jgi:hypothetical protein
MQTWEFKGVGNNGVTLTRQRSNTKDKFFPLFQLRYIVLWHTSQASSNDSGRIKLSPSEVTNFIIHHCTDFSFSFVSFPMSLSPAPWLTSKINYLYTNLCLRLCFALLCFGGIWAKAPWEVEISIFSYAKINKDKYEIFIIIYYEIIWI